MAYNITSDTFVNPYHFVRLDPECSREETILGNLTGWIECSLTTLTPIFIPNTSSSKVINNKTISLPFNTNNTNINSYDFFSYNALEEETRDIENFSFEPVISGSEIRGVIRSAFETLTSSCMSQIDDENVLYKRTPKPATPAILEFVNNEWELKECKEMRYGLPMVNRGTIQDVQGNDLNNLYEVHKDLKTGDKVIFESNKTYVKQNNGRNITLFNLVTKIVKEEDYLKNPNIYPTCNIEGYYYKGESFQRKHHETIFVPTVNLISNKVSEKSIENYITSLKLYRDEKVNILKKQGKHGGYSEFKGINTIEDLKGKKTFVYYSNNEGDNYYLSPACIGREVFFKTIKDIIGSPDSNGFSPCTNKNKVCTACSVFGMTGEDKNPKEINAISTRVRFTDANIYTKKNDSKDYYDPIVILPELASPKPSATEFYLKNPGKDMWNYDYAFNWNGSNKQSLNNYKAKIMGRKYYWHHNINISPSTNNISDRNTRVKPLKKDISFKFKVYFNNLNETELKKLIYILNIQQFGGAFKIGKGKPLGLGSISIKIEEINKRTIEVQNSNINYDISKEIDLSPYTINENELGCSTNVLNDFKAITKFDNGLQNIQYPSNTDDSKVFSWFGANRDKIYEGQDIINSGNLQSPTICQFFEPIYDEKEKKNSNVALEKYKKREQNNANQGNRRR